MNNAEYKMMIKTRSAVSRQPRTNTLNQMLNAKPKRHSVNARRPSNRKITLPKFKCMEGEG